MLSNCSMIVAGVALAVLFGCLLGPMLSVAFAKLRKQGIFFALIGAGFLVSMAEKLEPGITRYVDVEHGSDVNTGVDADHAFKTITNALARVGDGGTILVAPGTYREGYYEDGGNRYPNLSVTDGRHLTIRATGARDATIIDAEGQSSCLWLNTDHEINTNVVVEGFTLRNGNGSFLTGVIHGGGGAFGGWLKNCRIESCTAEYGGGAWWAKLEECTVENCSATSEGGGLRSCEADRTIVRGCRFDGVTTGRGAGVCQSLCRNCLIVGNTIASSVQYGYGAGAHSCNLYSCTVADNVNDATDEASGAGVYYANSAVLRNSIVYGNKSNGVLDELANFTVVEKYASSSTADPSFTAGDYTLDADSTAIDVGVYRYAAPGKDLAGNARVQGAALDLGCYERTPVLSFDAASMTIPGGTAVTEATGRIAVSGGTSPYTYSYGTTGVDARGGCVASENSFAAVGEREATLSSGSGYYTLPFAFPFGGETFTEIYVNIYGGLSFSPNGEWAELFNGYAGGWSNVTNNGKRAIIPLNGCLTIESDDPSMGVFVESSSEKITFRWSGWYSSVGPVNFSCTLRASGEISFAYGDYPADFMNYGLAGIAWADKTGINLTDEIPADAAAARAFTFRPTALPPAGELTLNSDGVITGTPMHYGNYYVKVTATDSATPAHAASQWLPIAVMTKYAVNFAANGAAGDPMSGWTDVAYDAVKTVPACTYTLAHSSFLGWSTNAAATTVYQPGDTVSGLTDVANDTVTFYALWKMNLLTDRLNPATGGTPYSQTLSAVGGSAPLAWSWDPSVEAFQLNAATGEITDTAGDGSQMVAGEYHVTVTVRSADNQSVSSNYVLSVTTTYKVRFNARGGTGAMDDQSCTWGVDATLAANAFALAGSTFQGWATNENGQVVYENGGTVRNLNPRQGGIANLYAVWSVQVPAQALPAARGGEDYAGALTAKGASGTVTWALDDGSAMPPGLTLHADGTITGQPTKGGIYTFDAKATDALGSVAVGTLTITNKTTYSVRFIKNADDATGEMENEPFVWGEPKALTACGFTYPTYDFVGWKTNYYSESAEFANGATVTNLTTTQEEEVYLWAVWHPGYYTLKFDVNASGVGPTVEPTVALSNRTVAVGSDVTMPPSQDMPRRVGYIFAGWSKTPNGSQDYSGGATYRLDQPRDTTLTLYAVWNTTDDYCTETVGGNDWTFLCHGENTLLNTLQVTNGATTVTIPATVLGGRPITQFGNSLLEMNNTVTELVFASGLTGFASGSSACSFQNMQALERVTFPAGFTNIISYAFYNCPKLSRVEFGADLVSIGDSAFDNCANLVSVDLPASVKSIGSYAFYNARKVSFSGAVETVGAYAFLRSRRLRFAGVAPSWSMTGACGSSHLRHIQHGDDVSWDAFEAPWPTVSVYPLGTPVAGTDGQTWYGRGDGATAALVDPAVAAGAVSLPETFGGKPATVLADAFLAGDGAVTSLTIPASVTNVEDYAFYKSAVGAIYLTGTNLTVRNQSTVYGGSSIGHVYYLPQHAATWADKTLFGVTTEPWPAARKWTAHFDANAGDAEGAMDDQLQPAGYEIPLTENVFRRPNKKFVRWETDESPSATYADGATPSVHAAGATVTFRAVWQDATLYTVKFDMNGGKPSVTPATVDLEVGVPESTVTLAALANEDRENCWTFLGWSANRAATVAEYAGGAVYRDATAAQHQTNTIYAIWEERTDWTYRTEPAEGYDTDGHRLLYSYKGDYAFLRYIEFNEGASGTLAIPAALGGRPVERVETSWSGDSHRANLKSLLIPASVKVIHSYAFSRCAELTNITFEAGSQLKEIAQLAFSQCTALPRIALPESLTKLGNNAFNSCTALTNVTLSSKYVGDTASGVFSYCPIGKLEIPTSCVGFGSIALNRTKALRFLGDRPTWDVYGANQGAATLIEFQATNTTWNTGKISWYETVPHKGFVGPIATMGAAKCYFWTNAENTVTFAYAEDALAAEVDVPASVTWGGVTWTVTGFEKNAFANQATTVIRYPAVWTERMWGVDPTTLAEGIVSTRPSGDYCTVTFSGGTGSTGTMADYYVPTGYATHLPSNTLAKTGYMFVKWQKLSAPTADCPDGAAFTGAAAGTTLALDASWEYVGNYTIRFVGNSVWAENVPADMTPPVGTTPAIPADPSREGWAFGGWTNAVNDNVYQAGDAFDEGCAKDSTFTLYAQWNKAAVNDLNYTDGNGSVWTYDREGDSVTIKNVAPGEGVETLELPESIKGSTLVRKASGYNLPEKVNGLWWNYEELANNCAKLTSVILSGPADLVMPSEIAGRTVTAFATVGQSLVTNRDYVASVEIPGTVTAIPQDAFYSCRNLTEIVLHEGTVSIGSYAFGYTALAAPIDFPESLVSVDPAAFRYVDSIPYDADGFMYADTGKTYLQRVRKDVAYAPEGVKTLANQAFSYTECAKVTVPESVEVYGGSLFIYLPTLREVVFKSPAAISYNSMFYQTSTVTNITLYGGEQEVGSFADSPSHITTVGFLTTPPSWNVTDKFPYATTICYYANYAADWADYKTAHPSYTYVELEPLCVEATVGQYVELDLEEDLGVEIPSDVDYTAGDKVAVKIEGLAKGLKLVTTPIKVIVGKRTVISGYTYTIEGVPTEAVDFATQPMYARVTTTYKDKTKGKVETLTALKLAIKAATVRTLTAGVLSGVYESVDIATLWPEVADAKENPKDWTFKGWPAGILYNNTAKEKAWSYKDPATGTQVKTFVDPYEVYGLPTKAGTYTITATHKYKLSDGKTTVSETLTAVMTVWADAAEKSYRYSDQVGVAMKTVTTNANWKSVAGLPTGIKWTTKDVPANAKTGTPAYPAYSLYGTPTKAGVFATTVTKVDPENAKKTVKETFLWLVNKGANGGILDKIGWTASESTVTVWQGVIQNWGVAVPDGAKVTVTGLPTGLKFAQDRTTKLWTLAGTPTKEGNYVVTFKTVLNGETVTERISIVVNPNEWTGNWYGVQKDSYTASSLNVLVNVAANGTVKLTLQEGKLKTTVKTSATAKNLDADGHSATLDVIKNKVVVRQIKVDFSAGVFALDGAVVADLCETDISYTEDKSIRTFVLEEVAPGETNAYAYVTATFDAKKNAFTLAGKLWDGTAVKGTAYPLAKLTKTEGNYLSPVLLTDKAKNAVYLELSDDGSYCRVLENGVKVAIGKDGTTPWTDLFSAADLKNKTFEGLVNADKLIVLADGDTESAPQQEVELPLTTKEQTTKAAANGLAKLTKTDEDGWKWVCEMLPVDNDAKPQFRGIATGTRKDPVTKKNVTQYAPVWSK